MPTYNGTNNYNQIDTTTPNGAVEPVVNLPLAIQEIKRVAEATMELQHNSDGSHQTGIITGAMIANGTVTDANIAAATITADKLASGVLTPAAGAIATSQIANSAVTTALIANSAVTTGKIAANAVTAALLAGSTTAGQLFLSDGAGNMALQSMTGDATIAASGAITVTKAFTLAVVSAVDLAQAALTPGSWITRAFSKVLDNLSVATFGGGGAFSLLTGSYIILASCKTFNTGLHQLGLFSATAAAPTTYTNVLYGLSSFAGIDSNDTAILFGAFSVSDATILYQLQHYVQYSHGTSDKGVSDGLGSDKYGEFLLVKYA